MTFKCTPGVKGLMLFWYLGFIVPVPTSLLERRTDGVDENRKRCINNQKVDRCKFFKKNMNVTGKAVHW